MKVLERLMEGLIRQRVEIDEMQCGFMSGRGTTDAIFIVRQLQEKHLAANKPLYMAWRKYLIEFHGMSSGGQCANKELTSGWCVWSSPCTRM